MGGITAPVDGSGVCPAWIALVPSPQPPASTALSGSVILSSIAIRAGNSSIGPYATTPCARPAFSRSRPADGADRGLHGLAGEVPPDPATASASRGASAPDP